MKIPQSPSYNEVIFRKTQTKNKNFQTLQLFFNALFMSVFLHATRYNTTIHSIFLCFKSKRKKHRKAKKNCNKFSGTIKGKIDI